MRASSVGQGHAESLELILQDEFKSLEDFDGQFNSSIDRKQIFELAAGQYLREAKDLRPNFWRRLSTPYRR